MGVLPSNLLGSRGLWLMEVHKGRKIQEEKERKGREQDGTNSKRSCGVLSEKQEGSVAIRNAWTEGLPSVCTCLSHKGNSKPQAVRAERVP
jgi:hypothetical protein